MGTLTSALYASTSALAADQAAIDITSTNTANANTPGYTREVPVWKEQDSVALNGQTYGTGVEVTSAASQRDRVLEQSVQQQEQVQSQTATVQTALQQVQAVFNSTGTGTASATGIGGDINSFFNSLSQLETSPADSSVRQGVLNAAQTLASDFNGAATQLQQQTAALNSQAAGIVPQVNALTKAIATLNQQIITTSPNADAGTLEDQRQQDIEQLSQFVGLDQISTGNNGLALTTSNGALLVSNGQSFALTTSQVGGNTHIYTTGSTPTDITSGLTGGQLGGIVQARDTNIPAVQGQLDTLAYGIASSVNTANANGVDANGNPGGNIFNIPGSASGSAAGISVAISNPSLIASAVSGEGPGGNTNATALANLATANTVSGTTPSGFYASFLSSVGDSVSSATAQNTSQQSVLTQLTTQRDALSGVTLDDEASNLTEFERSYQAASQVFSIIDTLVASALNLGESAVVT